MLLVCGRLKNPALEIDCTASHLQLHVDDAMSLTDLYSAVSLGPSIFVPVLEVEPPAEDVRYFDARNLVVHEGTDDQVRLTLARCCT